MLRPEKMKTKSARQDSGQARRKGQGNGCRVSRSHVGFTRSGLGMTLSLPIIAACFSGRKRRAALSDVATVSGRGTVVGPRLVPRPVSLLASAAPACRVQDGLPQA